MKEVKFLDLVGQYETIRSEIDAALQDIFSTASYIGGEKLSKFEADFGEFVGSNYCVGVGNGTDALEIAIESLSLPGNSEIIVPANSFIATSEAVSRSGHTVVFADCNADDYLLDVESVRKKVSQKTKAIIPVHLYGQMCDMESISAVAKEFDLRIIEDAAQAHGAMFRGKPVGSCSDIATYSFYPGKNLGAYGDGGAITTNNRDLATKCRMIANHGRSKKYDHSFEGRNSRLDTLQATILSVKLKYLPKWLENRKRCARIYLQELSDIQDVILPKCYSDRDHVFHLFVIRADDRDGLKAYLQTQGVQTGVHYPISLPDLDAYKHMKPVTGVDVAHKLAPTLLSLPIGEHLDDKDIDYVSKCLRAYFERN